MATQPPTTIRWRTSSYSQENGTCVEVGDMSDGRIAVRNSNDPYGPTVLFSRAELHAWVLGCKNGEFDDLI